MQRYKWYLQDVSTGLTFVAMLSYNDAFYQLKNRLQPLYDAQEAAAIAHELLEHVTGLSKLQRLSQKDELLNDAQHEQYVQSSAGLAEGKPLQYELGYAWFMGRRFEVNEHVLIPRPETEELVQWIIDDNKTATDMKILDVGSGSGCIPISLKLALPDAMITSCDISEQALVVARKNGDDAQADVEWLQLDFLNEQRQEALPGFNIIVSNPPYIPAGEEKTLHDNVVKYEPHLALFVPDDDALLFYKAIAMFGKQHLLQGGAIYCELHVDYAVATKTMFIEEGYTQVSLKEDMHGNLRMLKAMA
jgi:protein-(glutamine-N5) methyltransferase, release factor-specific